MNTEPRRLIIRWPEKAIELVPRSLEPIDHAAALHPAGLVAIEVEVPVGLVWSRFKPWGLLRPEVMPSSYGPAPCVPVASVTDHDRAMLLEQLLVAVVPGVAAPDPDTCSACRSFGACTPLTRPQYVDSWGRHWTPARPQPTVWKNPTPAMVRPVKVAVPALVATVPVVEPPVVPDVARSKYRKVPDHLRKRTPVLPVCMGIEESKCCARCRHRRAQRLWHRQRSGHPLDAPVRRTGRRPKRAEKNNATGN